jgi:hypothetical protein
MILETHSTESVTAFELKQRILKTLSDMGEPMREVTYDAITKRLAALEAENGNLRNALREIAETGPRGKEV